MGSRRNLEASPSGAGRSDLWKHGNTGTARRRSGKIWALDVNKGLLRILKEAEKKDITAKYDKVLLDAPCSGLGVLFYSIMPQITGTKRANITKPVAASVTGNGNLPLSFLRNIASYIGILMITSTPHRMTWMKNTFNGLLPPPVQI